MAEQFGMFDRVPPLVVWHLKPPGDTHTCQTQGKLYCGNCGRWVGFTGMYSWRLTEEEARRESESVWVNITCEPTGFCECGAFVWGEGAVFDKLIQD